MTSCKKSPVAKVGSAMLYVAAVAIIGFSNSPAFAQDDETPVSFTSAQASRGAALYRQNCLDCHGDNLDDGEFGGAPLRGLTFRSKWFDNTADILFDYTKMTMPPDRPGRLSDQNYADLVSYILSRNGIQPGAVELPADSEALAQQFISQ